METVTVQAAPVRYRAGFLSPRSADIIERYLTDHLPWLSVTDARHECWMNDAGQAYTYGSGPGSRTYASLPKWDLQCQVVRDDLYVETSTYYEGLFLNKYDNEKNALGWHSDDDPGIDHSKPIAVISLGAERLINFRPKGTKGKGEQILLQHGSLLEMLPGMQQTHDHKIPRHNQPCPPRISLTFRSLLPPKSA